MFKSASPSLPLHWRPVSSHPFGHRSSAMRVPCGHSAARYCAPMRPLFAGARSPASAYYPADGALAHRRADEMPRCINTLSQGGNVVHLGQT